MALQFEVAVYGSDQDPQHGTGYPDTGVKPDNVDFYVIIKAKVTAPVNQRPNKIQFVLRRGNDTRYEAGYLITDRTDADGPKDVGRGMRQYTYRTFGQRSKTRRLNWNVTRLRGRWSINVQGQASNTVQFKIDKRAQIVGLVNRWLNARQQLSTSGVRLCNNFTTRIYAHLGLPLSGGVGPQYKSASVNCSGDGCLVFYSLSFKPTWEPGHVAIEVGSLRINVNSATNPGLYNLSSEGLNDGVPNDYKADVRFRSTVDLDKD